MQFLSICGSTSVDSTNHRSHSTTVFTNEKNPHVSGPMQFKPALFNAQLHKFRGVI